MAGEAPRVTVETTAGNLVVELAPDAAPITVQNFLNHVRAGYYAGLVFHRVISGFVAQAGGYDTKGDRKAPLAAPIPLETSGLKHVDGALGMARLPEPNTATSEWYFCDGAQRDLDGNYCVFGQLVDGHDALRRILDTPTKTGDWPREPPIILRAYEGDPDPKNPAPAYQVPKVAAVPVDDVAEVRKAARKLRGRAAMLRARRPTMAFGEIENAVAIADRTGKRADLERAQQLIEEKEKK